MFKRWDGTMKRQTCLRQHAWAGGWWEFSVDGQWEVSECRSSSKPSSGERTLKNNEPITL